MTTMQLEFDGMPSATDPVAAVRWLAEPALSHRTDPDTSVIAARSQESRLSPMRAAVLQLFVEHPEGLTSSEVAFLYSQYQASRGWPVALAATPIKRKSDIAKLGLIVQTDRRRHNENGLPESVWVLA